MARIKVKQLTVSVAMDVADVEKIDALTMDGVIPRGLIVKLIIKQYLNQKGDKTRLFIGDEKCPVK